MGIRVRDAPERYRDERKRALSAFGDALYWVMPRGRARRMVNLYRPCLGFHGSRLGEVRPIGQGLAVDADWQRQCEESENED